MRKWMCVLLLIGFLAQSAKAQCEVDALREIDFPVKGYGLVQKWEFASVAGNELRSVEVQRAWWLGSQDLLLWGSQEGDDAHLGLYLLHKQSSAFDVGSWACIWQSQMPNAALGDYRNIAPLGWEEKNGKKLTLKLEDEQDLGIMTVSLPQSGPAEEQYLPLLWWDEAQQIWRVPCPSWENGMMRLPKGLYREGWESQDKIFAQAQYEWGLQGSLERMADLPASVMDKASKQGYIALGHGHFLLSGNKANPKKMQKLEQSLENSEHGAIKLHASLADFQKWIFEHEGPILED